MATTNFYPSTRQTTAYVPKTPTTPIPLTPNTARQTYSPLQQWNARSPTTPTKQRFNQPITTPSGSFLSSNTTLHPNSIFSNLKTPMPQTPTPNRTYPTSVDLARQAIAASSTFPDTPEGRANYQAALQAWEAIHPPAREADFTTPPYPLTLGTAPLGSRECYTCGIQGHITKDHDPNIPAVNNREQRWRAFIGHNLQTRTRIDYPIAQINVQDGETLSYDPAIYNAVQLDFSEEYENQGNGEEAHE